MKAFRLIPLVLLVFACSGPQTAADEETTRASAPLDSALPVLRFGADWSVSQSSPLLPGDSVRIEYDEARLPQCRGELNGNPAWAITGYYQLNGGEVGSVEIAGYSTSNLTQPAVIKLTERGDLAVWFQVTNRWGCMEWDTAYGANFHFRVGAQ